MDGLCVSMGAAGHRSRPSAGGGLYSDALLGLLDTCPQPTFGTSCSEVKMVSEAFPPLFTRVSEYTCEGPGGEDQPPQGLVSPLPPVLSSSGSWAPMCMPSGFELDLAVI